MTRTRKNQGKHQRNKRKEARRNSVRSSRRQHKVDMNAMEEKKRLNCFAQFQETKDKMIACLVDQAIQCPGILSPYPDKITTGERIAVLSKLKDHTLKNWQIKRIITTYMEEMKLMEHRAVYPNPVWLLELTQFKVEGLDQRNILTEYGWQVRHKALQVLHPFLYKKLPEELKTCLFDFFKEACMDQGDRTLEPGEIKWYTESGMKVSEYAREITAKSPIRHHLINCIKNWRQQDKKGIMKAIQILQEIKAPESKEPLQKLMDQSEEEEIKKAASRALFEIKNSC